jgi:hypothetical protein
MTTLTQTPSQAAELSTRVGPLAAVRHALTIAWRSLVQIRHNPMELGDLSLQPLMFVLLFAYVFGGAIAGSPKAYLQFGLAGIICQNGLFLTMNTGVALNADLTKGVFDRFRSLPIARSAPLAGRITADAVRQVWSMAILLGVGMLLGFRVGTNPARRARRDRGRYSTFAAPGAQLTVPGDINNRGQIVGFTASDLATETARGFLLAKGAKGPFTPVSVPGAPSTVAFGLNDRGQITGAYNNPNPAPSPPPATAPPMGRMA